MSGEVAPRAGGAAREGGGFQAASAAGDRQHRADEDERPVFVQIADLLTSGYTGVLLSKMLHHHFPSAGRADVYLACGFAMAIAQADIRAAVMEGERGLAEAEVAKARGRH
ncbi:MAG TPA: hypothetical protein VGG29_00645 [Caulobacteraceae bacterium]|jgi:hypothetical protein